MRPSEVKIELVSVTCPCGLSLAECAEHRPLFFDLLKERVPEAQKNLIGPALFSLFVDPVKAAGYVLQALSTLAVFGVVWYLIANDYRLGVSVSRRERSSS